MWWSKLSKHAVLSSVGVLLILQQLPVSAADAGPNLNINPKPNLNLKSVPKMMLSGAVIRYDKYSQGLSAEQWQQILDQLSELKIKTLVIRYHHLAPRKVSEAQAQMVELDFLPQNAPLIPAPPVKAPTKTEIAETKIGETRAAEIKFADPKAQHKKVAVNTVKTAKTAKTAQNSALEARRDEARLDATALILNYADTHQMNVYLGLWMDINWFANLDVMDQLAHNLSVSKSDIVKLQDELTSKKGDTTFSASDLKDAEAAIAVCKRGLTAVQEELDEKSIYFAANKDGQLAGPSIKMADALYKLYGKHPSFVGWYFPEEIWDAAFSAETIAVLNPLLKFVSNHCREISTDHERAFVMSPHASRLHYDSVDEIVASHSALLKDAGVDILMLQDSIGDLNLKADEDIAVRLKKHFTAFSKVCALLKIKLWAELESYQPVKESAAGQFWQERKPTSIARFARQIQYTYPYLDPQDPVCVVFDYLQFFSLLDGKYVFPEERAALYDGYKREFVDGDFVPLPDSK